MSLPRQLALHAVLLAGALCLFELTDIDGAIQDRFYDRHAGRWVVDRKDPVGALVFYHGPKAVLIAFGSACLAGWVLSYPVRRLAPRRAFCARMCLALGLVPLAVAGLKRLTNTPTPDQTSRYGGRVAYVKVLDRRPADFPAWGRLRGWPAGHASGGFALMMLYQVLATRRRKLLGLLAGLTVGWAMGVYQMLKGVHFLSHTVVTMSLGWIIVLAVCWATRRMERGRAELSLRVAGGGDYDRQGG